MDDRGHPPTGPLVARDLEEILSRIATPLEELRGKRLFVTGGTGFFGIWLHECLAWANQHLGLGVSAVVLTRSPDDFRRRFPHLAATPTFRYHRGDIEDFEFPEGHFSHVIHAAATSAEATFANEEPLRKLDLQVRGTRRALDFAVHCRADKVLFTSSGSVYGKQPSSITHIAEDSPYAPDPFDTKRALGQGKRAAESLCAAYAQKHGIEIKILRGFCFVGPYLQMDIHYAIGNFIRDAQLGRPIRILGDGTPRRSYLYAKDLMIWLWTIFLAGQSCRPYNVGSERDLSIAELAALVKQVLGVKQAIVVGQQPVPGRPIDRYVPCTERARQELGLEEYTDLATAIERTASHCVSSGSR